MRILVVEDDHLQAEDICPRLREAFGGCEVDLIKTESEFRLQLEAIAAAPPDVVVLDMMLRWADPSPDETKAPEDVKLEGYFYAGVRCARLLAERESTKGVPVILYTVLEPVDVQQVKERLSPSTRYLRKQSDLTPLIDLIRESGRR
ncbi:MAG: response regulator [Pyrinomonadaceae bacterium]